MVFVGGSRQAGWIDASTEEKRAETLGLSTAGAQRGGATVQLSMHIENAGNQEAAAARVVEFESAGIDMVWVAEAYNFDAVSYLGYLAAKTSTVQIGAGVLPLYTRTPTLLAMTAAGLDSLSGGRFILGLGASAPWLIEGFYGVRADKPLGRTREIVDICRQVWKREDDLVHEGPLYHVPLTEGEGTGLGKPMQIEHRPVRSSIPVYVASNGEKNVELTAEIADGWLPLFFVPDKANEVFGPSLRAGQARRDPALGPLDICAGGFVAIGQEKDVAAVRDLARPFIAEYVGGNAARGQNYYKELLERYGYEAAAAQIQDLYLAGKVEEAEAAVPAELLEHMSLVGPESYIKERVAAYREAGVTALGITPVGPNPTDIVEKLKAWSA
jgi:F420-dependent oxidoreductase-like protein